MLRVLACMQLLLIHHKFSKTLNKMVIHATFSITILKVFHKCCWLFLSVLNSINIINLKYPHGMLLRTSVSQLIVLYEKTQTKPITENLNISHEKQRVSPEVIRRLYQMIIAGLFQLSAFLLLLFSNITNLLGLIFCFLFYYF